MSKRLKIMLAVVLSTILTVSGVVVASRGTETLKANESLVPAVKTSEAEVPVVVDDAGSSDSGSPDAVKDGEYTGENWGVGGNGIIYYDANGKVVENEADAAFSLSKRAEKTSDNHYDVTLQFVTKTTTTTTQPGAAATVLVIDRSGSMGYCAECGKTTHVEGCKYYQQQVPVDNSVKEEQKTEHSKWVRVNGRWTTETYMACEYCDQETTHSRSCKYYQQQASVDNSVKSEQTRLAAAKTAAISFLNSYRGDKFPYATGLGRYVALVSYSSKGSVTQTWVDVSTQSGYDAMVSKINGLSADGGTNTDDGLYQASTCLDNATVKSIAASMKNVVLLTDGIPTYSRNSSDGGTTCNQTEYNDTVKTATSVKSKATLYTVCFGAQNDIVLNNESCGDFLKNKIASSTDKAYNADNADQLAAAFAAITQTIVSGLNGEGTTITDPIPSGVTIDASSIAGGAYADSTWSLGQPVVTTEGNVTYYTYTITYSVTIDADAEGFNDSEYHPINGKTILNFPDGTTTPSMEFPVPGVTGKTTLYKVVFNRGANGTFTGDDAEKTEIVYDEIKANEATPAYPEVVADEDHYFTGWDYERADLVKNNANIVDGVITFTAQYAEKTTVTIKGETATKPYNGAAQAIDGITVTGLPEGAELSGVTYAAAGTNASNNAYAGSFTNKTPKVMQNGKDITDHFKYEYVTGSLTITPVTLTITTPSDKKVYDGTELAAAGTISGFVADEGSKVTFKTGAEVTEIVNVSDTAEKNNTYELDWNGVVSTNYTIVEDLGTLTITPAPVTVKIVGAITNAKYDKEEHTASGYTVSIEDATGLYTEKDFSIAEGTKTSVSRVQYGQENMGLSDKKFTNNNTNFDVTFDVTDGYVKITKEAQVTVQIKGNAKTYTYNGEEQTVTGYEIIGISNDKYSEDDFKFTGTASAARTDVGTTPMGLTADMFEDTNGNFDSVTFEIISDGSVTINPLAVTVTVEGNSDEQVYNGSEQSVSGYEVKEISSSLYTADDFSGPAQDAEEATAARTEVGTTTMTLAAADFANTNESGNFTVTFNVTPGSMTIKPVTEEVVVEIVGNSDKKDYDGKELKVEGYTVKSISNDLYTESNISYVGTDAAKVAAQTNVGTDTMALAASDFENASANFTNVKFVVTPGKAVVEPLAVTVTANDNSKKYGEADPTLDAKVETLIGEDSISYDVKRVEGELVGTYTINVTGAEDQGNYKVSYVPGIFTITEPTDPSKVINKDHEGTGFNLGEKVEFSIVVKNIYNQEVVATVEEQDGVTIQPGNGYTVENGKAVATMAAGAEITVTAVYEKITEEDILAGEYVNNATVKFSVSDTEYKADDTAETAKEGAALSVEKTVKSIGGDEDKKTASLGDIITYTIEVTNIGNVTVKNITVEDELTGNTGDKALEVGTLAPGASEKVEATYTVTEDDILAGKIANTATAKGTAPNGDETEGNAEVSNDTDPVKKELVVEKTVKSIGGKADKEKASLNDEIIYEITVTNNGNVTVKDITVEDVLTGDKSLEVGTLAPGASKTVKTSAYKVTENDILAGEIKNTATATGTASNGEETKGEGDVTTETDDVDNSIEVTKKSNVDGVAKFGDTIAYTITVKNIGNVTISNVTVDDEKAGVKGKAIAGDIKPDESKSITVTYVVTEEDVLAGKIVNTATAKGSDPNGDTTKDDGTKEDPTEKAAPSLFVEKTSDVEGTASLGDTITYTIKVTNNGNVTVTDITVEDELTGNTGDKALEVGTLAPRKSMEVTATYVVTEEDIVAGKITNVATAKGSDPNGKDVEKDGTVENNTDTVDTTIEVVKTVKSIGGKADKKMASLNDEIVYEITVTNNGNVTMTNIKVEDELTGNTGDKALVIEELAPGKSETVETAAYVVTEADILAGSIKNVVTVKGEDPDNDPDNDPEGEADVDVPTDEVSNKISVEKTSDVEEGKTVSLGDTITYTITVTNEGNVTIANIKVEDTLTGNTGDDVIVIDELAPKAFKEYTVQYTVLEKDILAGTIVNTATATGTDPNGDTTQDEGKCSDDTDPIDNTLAVTKTSEISDGHTVAELGDTITYTITVKNNGNVTVSNITVEDELTGNTGDAALVIEKLAPGASESVVANVYTVTEADLLAGEIKNVATATGTDPKGKETTDDGEKEDPTEQAKPSIFVEKTVKSIGGDADKTKASLNDEIIYEITVTNNGNLTLTDVEIVDELTGDTFTIKELAPKASEKYTVKYTVLEKDILAGKVVNTVTVKGEDPDNDPDNDPSDDDEVTVDTDDVDNTITVEKTSSVAEDEPVSLGDTITYTITVKNDGNVTVSGITVEDELTGNINDDVLEVGILAPGEEWSTTVTYKVTEEDIVAGEIVNNAVAKGTDPNGDETSDEDDVTNVTDPVDGSYTVEKKIANAKSEYKIGDTIQYTITVTNTGNITRHNVAVTDQLTGAAGKAVIAANDAYVVSGTTATIAALAPGETVLVSVSYKVVKDDVNKTITNVAVAEASEDDPTEDEDPEPTPDVPAQVEKDYELTIHYQYADGSKAAADYTHRYLAGETFRIVSPTIDGYTPDYSAVNSPSNGMPAKDLTFTIVYKKNPTRETPTTEPTTEEETTVEETTEEETTVEETTEEETVEETTAPEAVITETEDGEYDLVVIEDEKTPAGDVDADHKCCILHFLLMLLAMILLCVYTDKRKKYQEDIHEAKKVLKEAGIDVDAEDQTEGGNK